MKTTLILFLKSAYMVTLNVASGYILVFKNGLSKITFRCILHLRISSFIFVSGTKAYQKLNIALMKTKLQNDIKKLSPDAQTSSLKGFHATLNHWHLKMICFSWLGTYCRYSVHGFENYLITNHY